MSTINRYDDFNEDFDNEEMIGKMETSDEEGLLSSLPSTIPSFSFYFAFSLL